MDVRNLYPNIEHGIFTWKIENFLLCVTSKNYTAESSTFILENSTWFLKLVMKNNADEISCIVQLCRGADDNPHEFDTRVLITMKSTKNVFASTEIEYTFKQETIIDIMHFNMTWNDFYDKYNNESDNDILLIECDIACITSFSKNTFSHDLKLLSVNLMTLLAMERTHNAYLVTEDTNIPVHKEILCAHSPVFEEQFQYVGSRLDIHYSPDVVQSMLRFLYSGSIREILINGSLPPLDLYKCAVEYKIDGLIKYLAPWQFNSESVIKCEKIKFGFEYPHFFNMKNNSHFRRKISDYFEVVVYFSCGDSTGFTPFKIKLLTSGGIGPVSIAAFFHILDSKGEKGIAQCKSLSFDDNEEYSFDFAVETPDLFTKYLILPENVLKMQCEFKLGHPEQWRSYVLSDMQYFTNSPDYPDKKWSLIEGMKNLFIFQIHSDLQLIVNSREMYVHKSVLSARSPVFRFILLQNNRDSIRVDLPVEVAEQLVFYMYTGKLSSNYTDFRSLYLAAEKYGIDRLQDICKEEFKQ